MKLIFFIIIILACSCSTTNFEYVNANKKNLNYIQKEKLRLARIGVKHFDTDTTINFKNREEIIKIFGKPKNEMITFYEYPSQSVLNILKASLDSLTNINIYLMEWIYKKDEMRRVVLFIQYRGEWITITNLLYDINLEF